MWYLGLDVRLQLLLHFQLLLNLKLLAVQLLLQLLNLLLWRGVRALMSVRLPGVASGCSHQYPNRNQPTC